MHSFGLAATHLVPVIARQFKFCPQRQSHLRQRGEIFKAGLAGDFLGEKPLHLLHGGNVCEPRKQRIVLAGPTALRFSNHLLNAAASKGASVAPW